MLIESYQKFFDNDLFDRFITSDDPEDRVKLAGSGFELITYDDHLSWTEAFLQSIEGLSYSKFLFSFDDLILTQPVDNRTLRNALELEHYDHLKVICSHVRIYDRVFRRTTYFDVKRGDSYRGSLVFSILTRELLDYIATQPTIVGLSAWQYEHQINSVLSDSFRYGCVRHNIIGFANLVIKGRVNPVSRLKLKRAGGLAYTGQRRSLSFLGTMSYHSKLLVFTIIKYLIPPNLFATFRNAKRKAINVLGKQS